MSKKIKIGDIVSAPVGTTDARLDPSESYVVSGVFLDGSILLEGVEGFIHESNLTVITDDNDHEFKEGDMVTVSEAIAESMDLKPGEVYTVVAAANEKVYLKEGRLGGIPISEVSLVIDTEVVDDNSDDKIDTNDEIDVNPALYETSVDWYIDVIQKAIDGESKNRDAAIGELRHMQELYNSFEPSFVFTLNDVVEAFQEGTIK